MQKSTRNVINVLAIFMIGLTMCSLAFCSPWIKARKEPAGATLETARMSTCIVQCNGAIIRRRDGVDVCRRDMSWCLGPSYTVMCAEEDA